MTPTPPTTLRHAPARRPLAGGPLAILILGMAGWSGCANPSLGPPLAMAPQAALPLADTPLPASARSADSPSVELPEQASPANFSDAPALAAAPPSRVVGASAFAASDPPAGAGDTVPTPSDDWSGATIRGQQPGDSGDEQMPGLSGYFRNRMNASEAAPEGEADGQVRQAQYGQPSPELLTPEQVFQPITPLDSQAALATDPSLPTVPFDVFVQEGRTGRFMFGMGVNSDAGLTGQITIDERNFDIWRFPRSWDDIRYGRAFRGGGQGFRLEAMPGDQVQRYAISFTEPYLGGTDVSFRVSGYLFDRGYTDWAEQRLGGRIALGYRLTPDLSLSGAFRAENVNVRNPRVLGVPELDAVVGDNDIFSGRVSLAHDTRDTPFAATQGHYLELAYEQVFGDFEYPRFELDWRRYFLIRERPDQSGRHTLAFTTRLGFSGDDTPVFENFFAGGFSTMRGFDFRGASPRNMGVIVGGRFQTLSSVEYMFPITQDDMIKGVCFVDYGTVEEDFDIDWDDYRVAPGFGLRINIPALGPAPLALDFAIPVAREDGDDIQNFSFYFGFGRG